MSTTSSKTREEVSAWLSQFNEALLEHDVPRVLNLFHDEECFWRDFVAFTWNIHTAESKEEIAALLEATLDTTKPSGWEIDATVEQTDEPSDQAEEVNALVEVPIKFETSVARCRGNVKLKRGKCWILFTAAWELKGHEEPAGRFRPIGKPYGVVRNRKTWLEKKEAEKEELESTNRPYCVIVGGGQAGIMLGARLKVLGVPTIILEKNDKAGGSWRNRHNNLHTHTPAYADHFPYMAFPTTWPVFPSKDQLAEFMECYTTVMGLNYWCSSECQRATFDEKEGRWHVLVNDKRTSSTKELNPVHLILATGGSGYPFVPEFKGADSFEGVQFHSSEYRKGSDWTGKQCVVIGACTSAHDICEDLWEQGAAQVTMVQKSSTCVIGVNSMYPDPNPAAFVDAPHLAVENLDLVLSSNPYKVLTQQCVSMVKAIAEKDAKFYEDLNKAGFKTCFGEDNTGLFMLYHRRLGGYYIDLGASELIINGEISVKSGVNVEELRPKSVAFSDGSEIPADLIVYATGYSNMKEFIAKLISQETADKVGQIWGLGSNTAHDPGPWVGEYRNVWKPTAQANFWTTGAAIYQTRQMSRYLAIQLKARMEGIQISVYNDPVSPQST